MRIQSASMSVMRCSTPSSALSSYNRLLRRSICSSGRFSLVLIATHRHFSPFSLRYLLVLSALHPPPAPVYNILLYYPRPPLFPPFSFSSPSPFIPSSSLPLALFSSLSFFLRISLCPCDVFLGRLSKGNGGVSHRVRQDMPQERLPQLPLLHEGTAELSYFALCVVGVGSRVVAVEEFDF